MVVLKEKDYREIISYAKKGLPNEVCGLLAGTEDGEMRKIDKVYYLTNTDRSHEHFTMDLKEQLDAVKDMRKLGITQIGNFHSHPETPSRPSQEDIRLAYDPKASYLILSLENEEKPILHSFRIQGGISEKEELIIEK